MKTIIVLIIFFWAHYGYAWNEYQTGEVDTTIIGDYTVYFYHGNCNLTPGYSGIEILRDGEVLVSEGECRTNIYNFCEDSTDYSPECVFRDINGDSSPEAIITKYWGGQHCCVELFVFSLRAPHDTLDGLMADLAWADIKDLDGDSIPEFGYIDRCWMGWKGDRWNWLSPFLVWKWDGVRFRVANYQFPEYVIGQGIYREEWKVLEKMAGTTGVTYDPEAQFPEFPPMDFGEILVSHIYAGLQDSARVILDKYWPEDIPGKEQYYESIWEYMRNNQDWDEISNSRW